jgi:predicted nucleotidyltransferase
MYALGMSSVGTSLRLARRLAGLSQRALARKADVPASTVGRIERGTVRPRMDTLERLAEALGVDLEIEFRVSLGQRVEALRPDIVALCEQYGAHHVEVFGSVAAGTAVDESDVDLLVDLDDDADLLTLVRLERELSELLGVDVDVVPRSTVDESFRGSASMALS